MTAGTEDFIMGLGDVYPIPIGRAGTNSPVVMLHETSPVAKTTAQTAAATGQTRSSTTDPSIAAIHQPTPHSGTHTWVIRQYPERSVGTAT